MIGEPRAFFLAFIEKPNNLTDCAVKSLAGCNAAAPIMTSPPSVSTGISDKKSRYMGWAIFALSIFSSAFLLFQIQPLIAKYILPWFGGSPGVWTTCMLFFQLFLLAGYAYAYLTVRYLPLRAQAVLHICLLAISILFLPVNPGVHWKPGPDTEPIGHILLLLALCLGLPYFVLSATGPLLQAWFSRLHPGIVPYRLYALSNVGSLLALVSFPSLFEPTFSRQALAACWAWGFGGFALCCGWCAWQVWRQNPQAMPAAAQADSPIPRATLWDKSLWFALPACGSLLLLATTNKMCMDLAVIPFLWVLPLSLYLLTFIICFDNPRWYVRRLFNPLLIVLLGLLAYILFAHPAPSLPVQIGIYCASLFAACMVCHGEVYRLRPDPRLLTTFYLLIAAGGAAGGVLVALVAPLVFRSYAELNWGIWLLVALLGYLHFTAKTGWTLAGRRWPVWPPLLVGVIALAAFLVFEARQKIEDTVEMSRNFYGVLRVFERNKDDPANHAFEFRHGSTVHGLQYTDQVRAILPTTYFCEQSGVGLALSSFPRQSNRRIGDVGLGVGTLAAYGRPGDTIRFYEINPDVTHLAETRFTYLKQCQAKVEVVLGDARLALENEPSQQFDILVLDAFSGDSVPVHLLTEQAFTTYLRHLKPDGVIVMHISNRYLELLPVARSLATHFNLGYAHIVRSTGEGEWSYNLSRWVLGSRWVLLSRNRTFLESEPIASVTRNLRTVPMETALWTDDYVSLFPILSSRVRVELK